MLRSWVIVTFLIFLVPFALVIYPCYLLSGKKIGKFLIHASFRIILWIAGVKVIAEGIENVDENEKYLVVSNHQSVFDIPVIAAILPLNIRILAKKELLKIPFFGQALFCYDFVFIDRKNIKQALKDLNNAAQRLKSFSFLIFPEGTRSKDGLVGKFKSAGLSIAYKNNSKILPVALYGVDKIMKPGKLHINKGTVYLKVFEPVEILKNETRQDLALRLRLKIADFVNSKNS